MLDRVRGMARPCLITLLAAASSGCLVDRSPLRGVDPPREDAWVEGDASTAPDAFAESPVDARVLSSDAFGPDAPAADGGPRDAHLCGLRGDACCAGRCAEGLRCLGNDVCDAIDCGSTPGGACCLDGTCPGSTAICVGGPTGTCQACGGSGEPCCAGRSCDDPMATTCDGTTCVACGGAGEPCCAAGPACRSMLTCAGDRCLPPDGTRGGRCRFTFNPCDDFAWCDPVRQICQPCGGAGEGCCLLAPRCMTGLSCELTSLTCR